MSAVSALNGEKLSIREFARRDGCNEKLVRKAISAGHLRPSADGKLTADLVGTGWRKTNRRAADTADLPADLADGWIGVADPSDAAQADPLPVVAERILAATGAPFTLAEAERVKENFAALLKQLEYQAKAGLLLPVADMEAVCGAVLDATRAGFLALPSRVSPLLASASTPNAAMQILTAAVHEVLRDLAATEVVVQDVKARAGVAT